MTAPEPPGNGRGKAFDRVADDLFAGEVHFKIYYLFIYLFYLFTYFAFKSWAARKEVAWSSTLSSASGERIEHPFSFFLSSFGIEKNEIVL